jgi:putative redox protein
MSNVVVRHLERDRFRIEIRGHELDVDQPIEDGGDDKAPTPTELFAASLASCVGFYAERFLRRHDLPAEGLTAEYSFEMATDRPARVSSIDVRLGLPAGIPRDRLSALRSLVEHCTVHNSVMQPPAVTIRLPGDP